MPSSNPLPTTWFWPRQCSVQKPNATWSASAPYYMQCSWDQFLRGSVLELSVSTATEGPPKRRRRRGVRLTPAVQAPSKAVTGRVKRPIVGFPSSPTGSKKRPADDGYVDDCEVKKLKVAEVQRVEEDIRHKFGFDETLTVEEVDRLIAIQEERLRMAELRFMQSRLRKDTCAQAQKRVTVPTVGGFVEALPSSTQSCSLENLCSLYSSSLDTGLDQPVDELPLFDLELQKFTSGVGGVSSMELDLGDFGWMGDETISEMPVQCSFDFDSVMV